jgi:hypothetical protein
LPNTKPTCTVTGEECTIDPTKYLLGKPTLCFNNGTGQCNYDILNGWGLCFEGSQGEEPRFNHSPRGCKDDQDCPPVWSKKDQKILQKCLKDSAVAKYIGSCDGQATPPVVFCNPDLEFNNCKTAIGECKVQAFCYPPDEAQRNLEAAEDIAKVDSSGGGPTPLD